MIGARGRWDCLFYSDNDGVPRSGDERCVFHQIRLNPNSLSDNHQRRKTACHELGHGVGLYHGNTTLHNDCMWAGTAPTGIQYEQYNQHHRDHANSQRRATS